MQMKRSDQIFDHGAFIFFLMFFKFSHNSFKSVKRGTWLNSCNSSRIGYFFSNLVKKLVYLLSSVRIIVFNL